MYRMSKTEYKGLLKVASEQVPFGIYCVEKGNYAELCNIKCSSITQLKVKKREYKAQGFRVLVITAPWVDSVIVMQKLGLEPQLPAYREAYCSIPH